MRARLLVALLAACLLPALALAQDDEPAPARPIRWKREVIHEGAPVTKRIAFVVDVSGSMNGPPQAAALAEVERVLSLFPDDGWMKVVSFSDVARVFDASALGLRFDASDTECACDAAGWLRLPSETLAHEAALWLSSHGSSGSTDLIAGLRAALDHVEDDLSVVLVHDGEPNGGRAENLPRVVGMARAWARERFGEDAAPLPIHIIGINPSFDAEPSFFVPAPGTAPPMSGHDFLLAIAQETKGTYVRHTLADGDTPH